MTGEVQFRDARTYRLLKTYRHGGQGTRVSFGSNPRIVRCDWGKMKPHFVDTKTGKRIAAPQSTRDFEVLLSPNKKYFVWAKDVNHIELWKKDAKQSHKIKTWKCGLVETQDIQFSPNGKTLAVAGMSAKEIPVQFFDVSLAK